MWIEGEFKSGEMVVVTSFNVYVSWYRGGFKLIDTYWVKVKVSDNYKEEAKELALAKAIEQYQEEYKNSGTIDVMCRT